MLTSERSAFFFVSNTWSLILLISFHFFTTINAKSADQALYPACPINNKPRTACVEVPSEDSKRIERYLYTAYNLPNTGNPLIDKAYADGWKLPRKINYPSAMYTPDSPVFTYTKENICRIENLMSNEQQIACKSQSPFLVDSLSSQNETIFVTYIGNARNNNASYPRFANLSEIQWLDGINSKLICKSDTILQTALFNTYMETPFIFIYVFYISVFAALVGWIALKKATEKAESFKSLQKSPKKSFLDNSYGRMHSNDIIRETTSIRLSDFNIQMEQEDIIQTGYNDHIFGKILLYLFGFLTVLLNLLMIIVIADAYEAFHPYNLLRKGEPLLSVFLTLWVITTIWLMIIVIQERRILNFFRIKSPLSSSQYVHLFKPEHNEIMLTDRSGVSNLVSKVEKIIFPKSLVGYEATVKVDFSWENTRCLEFQHLRYVYSKKFRRFIPSSIPMGITYANLLDEAEGLTDEQYHERLQVIGANKIEIKMPSIWESLVAEFFSFFYIYQIMCYYVWYYFSYWKMGFVMTIVIVSSATINILSKRGMQASVIQLSTYHTNVKVRRSNKWYEVPSSDLVPGDLIEIQENWILPCDLLIVKGATVCDESMLTGEAMPVQKFSCPIGNNNIYDPLNSGKKYTLFSGTKVLSSGRNEQILATVQSTGAHTSKGQLIQSILFPVRMRFKYDEHLKIVLAFLSVYGIICSYLAIYFLTSNEALSNRLNAWCYSIFMISGVMSPLLPVVITVGQVNASKRLKEKGIFCLNSQRITLSGKVRVFCFDKTGTLTKEGLDFLGYQAVNKEANILETSSMDVTVSAINKELIYALASCHSLGSLNGALVGNQVEMNMFGATGWELVEEEGKEPIVQSKDGKHRLQWLKRFEFDHQKMSMSVVMRDLHSGKFHIFCKGSYEKIMQLCNKNSIPSNYLQRAQALALDGCYVLGISHRVIDSITQADLQVLLRRQDNVEMNLDFLGLLLYRNELKSDTKEAIIQLKQGDIRVIMITGDNAMCGCYIARASGMITSTAQVILGDIKSLKTNKKESIEWTNVDTNEVFTTSEVEEMIESKKEDIELALTGKAFDHLIASGDMESLLFHTRIFSRMSPDGKVQCVQMHMEKGAVSGMCGDGGNDCGALRAAHVGIALSEAEASVVAAFTSKPKSIASVVDLCREGRCSLATSFASVKFLLIYGLVGSALRICQYYNGFVMAEWPNIITDGIILVGLSYVITLSRPLPTLGDQRPTSSLIGPTILLSLFGQQIINVIFMLVGLWYLTSRPWYCPFNPANEDLAKWWLLGDNALATCTFYLVVFQQQTGAWVFSLGNRYRMPIWRNYCLCIFFGILFGVDCFFILSEPNWLTDVFRIASSTNVIGLPDIPLSFDFRLNFFYIVMGNFFSVWFYEYFIILGPVRTFFRKRYYKDYLTLKL